MVYAGLIVVDKIGSVVVPFSDLSLVILTIIGTKTEVVITTVTTMAIIIQVVFLAILFLSSSLQPPSRDEYFLLFHKFHYVTIFYFQVILVNFY